MNVKIIERIIPQCLKNRINPEVSSLNKYMKVISTQIKSTDEVLDAGAGDCQYKPFFSHAKYSSTDFDDVFDSSYKGKHTFTCSLDNIPKEDNTYDVIINTQVLEHVEDPQKVLMEFKRILKPGGKLFLTVPQCWGIHGVEPYNYFFFTKFGIDLLLKRAGFKVNIIRPRGGIFWLLGSMSVSLPMYIFHQYIFKIENGRKRLRKDLTALLAWPLYIFSIPFFVLIIPIMCYYLDFLDIQKKFTLGYEIYANA